MASSSALPPSDDRELLIIGDSRLHQLAWAKRTGFKIRLISEGGLRHEKLLKIAEENITEKTSILVLVCLQVELHSRTIDRKGKAGMVYANPTPPLDSIVTRLSCADHGWKKRGITTVWVAPYTPNLVLHNTIRKCARKWGIKLMRYEEEMAEHFMDVIEENRMKLLKKMQNHHLDVLELKIQNCHLTKSAGSDGLHLGAQYKRELFGVIISEAIEMQRAGPPNTQKVELPLNPALREAVNEVRKQKRKMRRTRAAERAIFDAAEKEKLAQVQEIQQPSFDQMIEGPQTKKIKID